MNIQTPRTDEEAESYKDYYTDGLVSVEFARTLEREIEELKQWKQSAITVDSWWAKIDAFVRAQPEALLGKSVAGIALEWLHEWRAYKDAENKLR